MSSKKKLAAKAAEGERLATMSAESRELVDKEEIAERFGVTERTLQQLLKKIGKGLKKCGRENIMVWVSTRDKIVTEIQFVDKETETCICYRLRREQ